MGAVGGMQIKGGKALAERTRAPAEAPPPKHPEESDSDSERGCTLVINVETDPGI